MAWQETKYFWILMDTDTDIIFMSTVRWHVTTL